MFKLVMSSFCWDLRENRARKLLYNVLYDFSGILFCFFLFFKFDKSIIYLYNIYVFKKITDDLLLCLVRLHANVQLERNESGKQKQLQPIPLHPSRVTHMNSVQREGWTLRSD